MTKQHWAILGILALAVVCLYCLGGMLVLQMFADQSAQIVAALESTPAGATIVPPPLANATAIAPLTPTPQPTARPSATWVIPLPQAPTRAVSASPRAPRRSL
jgi:hypothetical protein